MIGDRPLTNYERVKRSIERRQLTAVQLLVNPAELSAIDRLAEHMGLARTAAVRWVVTEFAEAAMRESKG